MARPRQFDEEQVIESLMQVFWEKGYEAASMQDLVKASGLLKGSLYGAFGDKNRLYLTALRHYDRTRIQAGIDMLKGPAEPREKVSNLFDSVVEAAQSGLFAGGCLLCNASLEMAAIDPGVGEEVRRSIARLNQSISAALRPLSDNNADADSLAALVTSAYFGARVLAKAGAPVGLIRAARDRCLKLLD